MEKELFEIRHRIIDDTYDLLDRFIGFIDAYYNATAIKRSDREYNFKCGGMNLCTVTLMEKGLQVLVIFGREHQYLFDNLKHRFSHQIQKTYHDSMTYHDGKWMFFDVVNQNQLDEIIELIKIKKKPNRKVMTMCGYKCSLCKAYYKNVQKQDQREGLSDIWGKYYDGLSVPIEKMICDGCRSTKSDAHIIDSQCPIRSCVVSKKLEGCYECDQYPCEVFSQRIGLCYLDAKKKLGKEFSSDEYTEFLEAYDNVTRINRMKRI